MSTERPDRLSPVEEIPLKLLPLRRAERLDEYFLYWIPVSSNPVPLQQRIWLNTFLDRVSDHLTQKCGFRSEVFLQFKTVYPDLLDKFLDLSLDLVPILGFGRKPGVPLPPIPSEEEIKKLGEGKPFVFGDYVGDFSFWFLGKDERKERESFLGYGGMTILFLPPDPNRPPPKKVPITPRMREHPAFRDVFAKFNPDQVVACGQALGDKWLNRSLELYGEEIPKSQQTKHMPFIVPLLKSADFLGGLGERQKLSELCEFYVTESLDDRGVLLASGKDHQDAIIEIIEVMREEGRKYPER